MCEYYWLVLVILQSKKGKSENAINWIKGIQHRKQQQKYVFFKISLNYLKHRYFDLVQWQGDWSVARNVFERVSAKLNIEAIESGYHKKGNIIEAS